MIDYRPKGYVLGHVTF